LLADHGSVVTEEVTAVRGLAALVWLVLACLVQRLKSVANPGNKFLICLHKYTNSFPFVFFRPGLCKMYQFLDVLKTSSLSFEAILS
jgi:hypothetical protein